jgi:hypothetical protein
VCARIPQEIGRLFVSRGAAILIISEAPSLRRERIWTARRFIIQLALDDVLAGAKSSSHYCMPITAKSSN